MECGTPICSGMESLCMVGDRDTSIAGGSGFLFSAPMEASMHWGHCVYNPPHYNGTP